MIRIEASLLPGGDVTKAKSLGAVEIANVGGTRERGEYAVRMLRAGKRRALLHLGKVVDFPRLTLGVWDLLLRALADVVVSQRDGERRTIAVPAAWQKSISDAALETAEAEQMRDRSEEIGEAIRAWLEIAPAYRKALVESLRARDESGAAIAAATLLAAWEKP